ncbi:MAG TPA: hypothetical protein VGO86_13325 [Candidatus Dormibacteraeota bacterium]|jgi:hypothetical protein
MATTEMILETVGLTAGLDRSKASQAIDALMACERDSTVCGNAMAALGGELVVATHAAADCADICGVALRVLERATAPDPRVVKQVLQAAIAAADRSASLCGQQSSHHTHCRVHSESARQAADACRALVAGLTG